MPANSTRYASGRRLAVAAANPWRATNSAGSHRRACAGAATSRCRWPCWRRPAACARWRCARSTSPDRMVGSFRRRRRHRGGRAALAGLAVAPLARRIAPPGLIDLGPAQRLPRLPASQVMLHSRVSDAARRSALRTWPRRSARSRGNELRISQRRQHREPLAGPPQLELVGMGGLVDQRRRPARPTDRGGTARSSPRPLPPARKTPPRRCRRGGCGPSLRDRARSPGIRRRRGSRRPARARASSPAGSRRSRSLQPEKMVAALVDNVAARHPLHQLGGRKTAQLFRRGAVAHRLQASRTPPASPPRSARGPAPRSGPGARRDNPNR